MPKVPFSADTYPYERVQPGYNRLEGAEEIPLKIIKYLLDLPDSAGYMPVDDNSRPRVRLAKYLWYEGVNPLKIIRYLLDLPDASGYQPVDDNSRPRVRLAKYLWYEGVNPLNNPLPTPAQKLSLLFDGENPEVNTDEQKRKHPKGYRLFPQIYWGPVELDAQVSLKCYMGRTVPYSDLDDRLGIYFQIMVNSNLEATTRTDAYSRAFAIETDLISALHGVNIAGVGTIVFSRRNHIDDGSMPLHDNGTHVGRQLHMSIQWMEGNNECVVKE